jgi:SNF2 family DNA or RNA helicase
MTSRYLAFFQQDIEQIPKNFIEFCCVTTKIDHLTLDSFEPLHIEPRSEQSDDIWYSDKTISDKKFGKLDIIQKKPKEGKSYSCLAHFYTHFDYLEGFRLLLSEFGNIDYYRLRTESVNCDSNRVNMEITLYVDRMFLLNMYEREEVPILIRKILTTGKHLKRKNNLSDDTPINLTELNHAVRPRLKASYKRLPFRYQAENIQWMSDQENKIDRGILVCSGPADHPDQTIFSIESIDDYLIYNQQTGKMVDPRQSEPVSVEIRGGVLADDIGLGKTMSMIGLMMEKKAARLAKTAADPKKSLIRLKPAPSLVLCPGRLCKQWEQEIALAGRLKSITVATIAQYRRLLKLNVRSFDVVIMSYNFLVNANYLKYIETEKDALRITFFDWERVILDEGHEFMRGNRRIARLRSSEEKVPIRDELLKIRSKYRWICSGTPFTNQEDCWYLIAYLSNCQVDIKQQARYQRLYYRLLKSMFRKNTKEIVAQQVEIPRPNISTEFLTMTSIERSIYNSALGNREKMIQYCNHIMVSEDFVSVLGTSPLPLEEIHQKMSLHYQKRDLSLEKQISQLDEKINGLKLIAQQQDITFSALALELSQQESKRRLLAAEYQDNHAKFKIFHDLSEKIKESGDCPICYSEFNNSETRPVITPCGHIFCLECMEGLYGMKGTSQQPCPVCRFKVGKQEINIVKQESDDQVKQEREDIDKWGTKMAHLIKYLRKVLAKSDENRVIVFSQWDSMLKLVSKSLSECEVKHIFLNGSVHVVTGRIRRFKLDTSIRVCLLSSDKSVSGLNLTEANHIVLLDTLDADREAAQVIEEQAIGRSVRIGQTNQVRVQRFVMMNSIEHDYYLNNIGAVTLEPEVDVSEEWEEASQPELEAMINEFAEDHPGHNNTSKGFDPDEEIAEEAPKQKSFDPDEVIGDESDKLDLTQVIA